MEGYIFVVSNHSTFDFVLLYNISKTTLPWASFIEKEQAHQGSRDWNMSALGFALARWDIHSGNETGTGAQKQQRRQPPRLFELVSLADDKGIAFEGCSSDVVSLVAWNEYITVLCFMLPLVIAEIPSYR